MLSGCCTALVTPFKDNSVDYKGLVKLVEFQLKNRISGILAAGTTGESPTLTWDEHNKIIENIAKKTKNKCFCIAGTGSNNTKEALSATDHAASIGVDAVLLVDPYYNGPSSLEIRKEYIEPVATAFPNVQIIPYVIPGRTGTLLLPEDLAMICNRFKNVKAVKEATGDLENMKRIRNFCGPGFSILSGDDAMTYHMMTDPEIKADGVVSVISNIAPDAVAKMVRLLKEGDRTEAKRLAHDLKPLFELVTIKTIEQTPYGKVTCRARNPLSLKVLMSILGMPSGGCRRPLGKITANGLKIIIETVRNVHNNNPEILSPAADFFGVNINERLNNPSYLEGTYYEKY